MILSLFAIFCISLGVVSAGDNVDISVDDISDDCVRNNVNIQTDNVKVNEDINNLSEEYRTFKELNETISNCTTNEITLEYDYKYDSNNDEDFVSGINIDKNISINGNGHIIDGFNIARAFNVNANQVSIKNLKFTNCNSTERGGAISGNCSVSGCSFVNCLSKRDGGAISGSCSVSGCSFVNCRSSMYNGGAIYGSGSVSGCSFVGCSAIYTASGGAIYFSGYGSVSGCSFVGCSAYYDGGAIFFHEGNSVVVNCSFVNCSGRYGGAIYFEENGSVTYCIFENNVGNGNAIYVDNSWLDVDYNFFGFQNNVTKFSNDLILKSNASLEIESIIPNNWIILNITNSSNDYFVNFVLNDGSSLNESMMDYNVILTINDTDAKEITIKNNSFNDTYLLNSVYKVNSSNTGKLIASAKFGYIEDSFTTLNDLISNNSPVILNHNYKFYNHWDDDFKEGIIIGDNVIIEGNGITINGSGVSKVFRITGENVTIKGINFNARCDSEGGAIYWSGNNGVVSGCSFTNCYTKNEGGAIYWNSNNSYVVNCSFMNCTAFHQGGAIYGNSCNNCSVSGCSFVNCSSNGFVGAIHLVSGNNCSINYCIFEGNSKYIKDIYVKSGTVNADFNFFGFQNNVTSFPQGLVSGVTLNSWVVLNITNSSNDYFVDFVLNDGSSLSESMIDYDAVFSENDVGRDIVVKDNVWSGPIYKSGDVTACVNSPVTGALLASLNLNTFKEVEIVLPEDPMFVVGSGDNYTVVIKSGGESIGAGYVVVLELVNGDKFKNYTLTTDDEGSVSLPINLGYAKVYGFNIYFDAQDGYAKGFASQNITVKAIVTKLVTDYVGDVFNSSVFSYDDWTAKLVDTKDNPISSVVVNVNFTGLNNKTVVYKIKSDVNGDVKLPLRLGYVGTYKISASLENNSRYADSSSNVTSVNIKKASVYIIAEDVNTTNRSGENYTVQVLTTNDKAVNGGKVYINFTNEDGVGPVYKLKTNADGKAFLPLNLAYAGTYNLMILFNDTENYNKKVTITTHVTVVKDEQVLATVKE